MSSSNQSSSNLLRRYLSGAITAPEEAELERRAQTDEPLAEAMQGLQSAPEEDHAVRVSRMLDAARQQGQKGAKIVRTRPQRYRWAATAAVLLLVVSALFILPSLIDSNVGGLAMESATQQEPTPSSPDELSDTPSDFTISTPAEEDTKAAPPTSPAPSTPTQDLRSRQKNEQIAPPKTGGATRADEKQVVARDQALEKKRREDVQKREQSLPPPPPVAFEAEADIAEEEIADEPEVESGQHAPPPAPTPSVAAASPTAPVSTAVRPERVKPQALDDTANIAIGQAQTGSAAGAYLDGLITNENGYPILNALVRLPGLPLGERTDSNGVFQLPADAAATTLVISHPDYESERVNLTDLGEKLQISLERKPFVPEDNRPRWQQSGTGTRIIFDNKPGYASPLEGYNALRKRIEDNRPADVPVGKVKLSFLVNLDGTLTDIQFRGKPAQATMDYIGQTLVRTSVWEVVRGKEPVRVYFKVVFK